MFRCSCAMVWECFGVRVTSAVIAFLWHGCLCFCRQRQIVTAFISTECAMLWIGLLCFHGVKIRNVAWSFGRRDVKANRCRCLLNSRHLGKTHLSSHPGTLFVTMSMLTVVYVVAKPTPLAAVGFGANGKAIVLEAYCAILKTPWSDLASLQVIHRARRD